MGVGGEGSERLGKGEGVVVRVKCWGNEKGKGKRNQIRVGQPKREGRGRVKKKKKK